MSQLFTPYQIGQLTLPNRIVIAPMCQYSAINGEATDWHLLHLGNLAISGAGLLIIEATAVEPEGRISPADLGLWSDATEAALDKVLKVVRRYSGMPIAIQLGHAGRKASTAVPWEGGQLVSPEHGGWPVVAPSALPYLPEDPVPIELDQAGLQRILAGFVSAAQRAYRLGIDAIEIHAAHGICYMSFYRRFQIADLIVMVVSWKIVCDFLWQCLMRCGRQYLLKCPLVYGFLQPIGLMVVGIWNRVSYLQKP